MSNVITNDFNTNHNEFTSYDRITDVLLLFSQNISLCFNVILAYKNKDNERRFMHSESQYPTQKYTGNPEIVSIKRMVNFYFSIEDAYDRDNWILLGVQHVFFLKDFLKTKVLPWYPGYGTGVYESGETGLVLTGNHNPVVFEISRYKSLGFEPDVFDDFRGGSYPGVRMYINGGKAVVEIGYDMLMSFYYILENTDMYGVASSMLTYVKTEPYEYADTQDGNATYETILSGIQSGNADFLKDWLSNICQEGEDYSAEAKELLDRLEVIVPTPKAEVSFFVAECSEFHSLGEYHEAADRFRELRHQPYIATGVSGAEGEIPPALLTFGIQRKNPHGAVDLLQVRAGQNVLSDDFMRMSLFAGNPIVTNALQRLENEFGFDQVLSQRPMTPDEVRACTYERFKEKLEQGGLPGTEEYLSQFNDLYAIGKLDALKPLDSQQTVTELIPINSWEHPCFEIKQDSPERLADAVHVFSHQYDELSGQTYTEILSQLSGNDAGYLHEWLGSIVAEDSAFSAQARELQARLEAISPAIAAAEQVTPETPDETRVTYYVAECMEFHSAGEYHEGVSLEEALQIYSQIDPHRISGIPGIGIHVENNDRYDGEYELMSNGQLLTDANNEASAYRDNPYVQQATADLTAALATLPPAKEPVDRTAEPKEAVFDFNGRYLHMQLSADNDWDYTVYSRNMEPLDGGRVGDAYTSFAAARADLMQEYRLTGPFKEVSTDQFEQMLTAHEESLHCPVCQLTLPEARAQGSLDEWRISHQATQACARQFNEQYGDAYHSRKVPAFLNMMVARYGMERCKIVLASTIQSSPWDGRYHPYVRDGANQVKIPGASEDRDHDRRLDYLVSCHPVTVDVAFRDLMQMEKEQALSDRPKAPQKEGESPAAPASGQKRPSVLKKLAAKQAEIAAGDSKAKPVDRDKPQL